jgi:hypothetical protein
MATAAVLPPPASSPLLAQWRGLNDDEATQFVNDAIEILSDSAMVAEFEKKVGDVGNWANEVDKAFDGVTRTFVQVVNDYGKDFSGLSGFLSEWRGYNSVGLAVVLELHTDG